MNSRSLLRFVTEGKVKFGKTKKQKGKIEKLLKSLGSKGSEEG